MLTIIKDLKVSQYLIWHCEDHIHLFVGDRLAEIPEMAMELQIATNNQGSQHIPTLKIT